MAFYLVASLFLNLIRFSMVQFFWFLAFKVVLVGEGGIWAKALLRCFIYLGCVFCVQKQQGLLLNAHEHDEPQQL